LGPIEGRRRARVDPILDGGDVLCERLVHHFAPQKMISMFGDCCFMRCTMHVEPSRSLLAVTLSTARSESSVEISVR
jgi:hypothetical protein